MTVLMKLVEEVGNNAACAGHRFLCVLTSRAEGQCFHATQ